MGKWIEIFKTGTHTAANGETKTFTEKELDKIVNSYDPLKHEAPVVIGHPKDDAPAWGWVAELKRVGATLFYKEKNPVDEFTRMRQMGLFKKRSISLWPDNSLKHIGWLGAVPPAVKGLTDVKFKEAGDCLNYEFNEENMGMDEILELKKKLF